MRKINLGEIVSLSGKTGKLIKMETPTNTCETCTFCSVTDCPANSGLTEVACSSEGLEFEDIVPVKGDKVIVLGITEIIVE